MTNTKTTPATLRTDAIELLREIAARKRYDPNARVPWANNSGSITINLKSELLARVDALLDAAPAAPVAKIVQTGHRLTDLKANDIIERDGCELSGVVLTRGSDGARFFVERGAVRLFTNDEMQALMHPTPASAPPTTDAPQTWFTAIFRDVTRDEATALVEHPKWSAGCWGHAFKQRDEAISERARIRADTIEECANVCDELADNNTDSIKETSYLLANHIRSLASSPEPATPAEVATPESWPDKGSEAISGAPVAEISAGAEPNPSKESGQSEAFISARGFDAQAVAADGASDFSAWLATKSEAWWEDTSLEKIAEDVWNASRAAVSPATAGDSDGGECD